ncbi:MAG: oxidoreductase [Thermodesulfobacteriota bacterium]
MDKKKLQIALYWGAACGGCDVAVLDTNEFILDVAAACDIRMWPIAADGKYKDIEAMADGELDLAIFNGAIRTSENEHIAKLLRKKSKTMVAFGSCAHLGGIPAMANQFNKEEIFEKAYLKNPSIQEGNAAVPTPHTRVEAGELEIPVFYKRVYKLDDIVDVDYYLPGCPPAPEQVKAVLKLIVSGGPLPAKGSVVGASDRALCDDCQRKKEEKMVKQFHRPWQILQDPERCLMEQGILCAGSATRSGCGVRCPNSNMPCRGCYGPLPGVVDQGAKILSAVSSIIDSKDPAEIEKILEGIQDITGYAYRFGMAASLLQRSVR